MNWNESSTPCDSARAAIADALVGRVAPDDKRWPEAHLAQCAECRSYKNDCEKVWAELGTLAAPPLSPGAHVRLMASLHVAPRRSMTRRALLAASLIAAAGLGYLAAQTEVARGALPAASASDTAPRFLLLLYDPAERGSPRSADAINKTIAEYSAWASGLRAAGKLVSAEKLTDSAGDWFGGSVAASAGERVGGFFVIRARNVAEAQRIAETCPHLKHGGRIELRRIQPT